MELVIAFALSYSVFAVITLNDKIDTLEKELAHAKKQLKKH